MGSMGCTMLRKGSKVSDFMDQRKQKLVGIEIYVEGDGLNGLISAEPKISEFGVSRFFNEKMKGAFLPKLKAIGNCAFGEMPVEETKEL
jgi:hypothetical protein